MYRIFSVETSDNGSAMPLQLQQHLEAQGYQLLCHQGGADVMEEIKTALPDLVLMDPTLPAQGGYKICEALKNDPETENIPVIFIHAEHNGNGALLKSFESGATDFVSIEAGEIELMARMKAAIRDKQSARQSAALAQQLNKMNTELYERNLQVEKELYVARQLQQSLLPSFLPDEEGTGAGPEFRISKCHYRDERLRISGLYLPCDALGGDIYDVIKFPNDTIGVAIADVSGHGVPAGFITAIFKSSFYRITHTQSSPGDILFHLNNELADIVKTGEYVTAVYSRIRPHEEDPSKLVLDYSGAGHPYPIYYQASTGQNILLKENGTPLVWVKDMAYPVGSITLEPGDRVLLYTDGLTEMRNTRGELYGEERFIELFSRLVKEKPRYLLDELIMHMSDFTEGHQLEDDLSVVIIEML